MALSVPKESLVTVVARPRFDGASSLRPLVLAAPDREVDGLRFRFRILKGHTIDRLLEQRSASKQEYYAIGAAGAALVAAAAKNYIRIW